MTKQQRIDVANKAIKIIASHGRKFFSLGAEWRNVEVDRVSEFALIDKRLYFIDKYTLKPIYVAYRRGEWRNFTEGGTLRDLICAIADWINDKAKFPLNRLGPWPEWICDGDLWGYAMADQLQMIQDLLPGRACFRNLLNLAFAMQLDV